MGMEVLVIVFVVLLGLLGLLLMWSR